MLSKLKNKIIRKYYRRKAKRDLIRRYRYQLEVENMMEMWITKRILDGQKGRRKELSEKKGQIREMELFMGFLKKL